MGYEPALMQRLCATRAYAPRGCWVRTGAKTRHGYGKTTIDGKAVMGHRIMCKQWKGPLPQGQERDHLCRNRRDRNPEHFEPVTHRDNLRRGHTVNAKAAAQQPCRRGQTFSGRAHRERRGCHTCLAATTRVYRARHTDRLNAEQRARSHARRSQAALNPPLEPYV